VRLKNIITKRRECVGDWQAAILDQLVLHHADHHDDVNERQRTSRVDRQRTGAAQRPDDRLQHGWSTVLGRQAQERH